VYYDEGISPGHEWTQQLADAIDASSQLLYFVSPSSVASRHCRNEVQYALDQNKHLIAVYLQPTELPGGLKLSLGSSQAILRHQLKPEDYRRKLGDSLGLPTGPPEHQQPLPIRESSRRRWIGTGLVLLGLAVVIGAWRLQQSETPSEKHADPPAREANTPTIAVLPFANLGGDAEAGFLGEGIAEDLINRLTRGRDIRVIARTSSFQFRDHSGGIQDIVSQLSATHLVEGSVRRVGDQLRVTVKFVDAADGTTLWSEQYDRAFEDLFDIQDDIAGSLASRFRVELAEISGRPDTIPAPAYTLLQQARQSLKLLSGPSLQRAILLAEEATKLSPDYVDAWVTLAQAHGYLWASFHDTSEARLRLAEQAGRRAIELDPNHPMAKVALANLLSERGEWQAASAIIYGSTADTGTHVELVGYQALVHAMAGRLQDAVDTSAQVLELDPLDPSQQFIHGLYLHFVGDFSSAIEHIEDAAEMGYGATWLKADLGLVYFYAGDDDRAVELWLESLDDMKIREVASMGAKAGGFRGMLRAVFEHELETEQELCRNSPKSFGTAYAAAVIERVDVMFDCLKDAARSGRTLHLMGHRQFRPYRSDPRVAEVLDLNGLSQIVDPELLR
jgi:TolB-like protein/Flp pilus assembly protein TadD